MSPAEIDRLHVFRETGRFINSPEEFQELTQISDSLLSIISPNFKFPEWKTRPKKAYSTEKHSDVENATGIAEVKFDLNKAKAEDLIQINGVGAVLSGRILKFRNALGGFLSDDQLNDVYGLKPEVVQRILRKYTVISRPEIQPISLREANADELSRLVYITQNLAFKIIRYRDSVGELKTLEELTKLQDFPADRFNRIKLYLTL